jgi:hypothetical protein
MITQNTTIQYNTLWRNTNLQEIYLEVDTTNQPITITLPEIISMGGFYNVKFYITDTNGNSATNNITVSAQGSDLIDSGSSIIISTNYGSVLVACAQSSWIALESSNIPPAIPPKVDLLADGALDMGVSDLQYLNTYYTKSIVTDVVLFYVDGAVSLTNQGVIYDGNSSNPARVVFTSGTEVGLRLGGDYINKDTRYTIGNTPAVSVSTVVQQRVRTAPYSFQSAGLDTGVSVKIQIYGYNLDA